MSHGQPSAADVVRGTTTPAREMAAAVLLGADPGLAEVVVRRLVEEDVLGDGVVLLAVLAATRRGSEVEDGLRILADGGSRLPSDPSSYERRVVGAEARDLLADATPARRALARTVLQRATADDAPVVARGADHLDPGSALDG